MNDLGNILVMGAGAAGLGLATFTKANSSARVGVWLRNSDRGRAKVSELNDRPIHIRTQQEHLKNYEVTAQLDEIGHQLEGFNDYETVMVCLPSTAYGDVTRALCRWSELKSVKQILLIAAPLGANALLKRRAKEVAPDLDIISLSSFPAAMKFNQSSHQIQIKGKKGRIFLSQPNSPQVQEQVISWLSPWNITASWQPSALEVESRNINLYAHPTFAIHPRVLDHIFGQRTLPVYLYRFEPEGPLSLATFRKMVAFHEEIAAVLAGLGCPRFNVLAFLNDDGYPLPASVLSQDDIQSYTTSTHDGQVAMMMARYAGLLVDPHSTPDPITGEYFPFSKVAVPAIAPDGEKPAAMPRIPAEEYLIAKMLQLLGSRLATETPITNSLVLTVEQYVQRFEQEKSRTLLPALNDLKDLAQSLTEGLIVA